MGRGRPPKQQQPVPVKTGRGRPPKQQTTETKVGRGRPAKQTQPKTPEAPTPDLDVDMEEESGAPNGVDTAPMPQPTPVFDVPEPKTPTASERKDTVPPTTVKKSGKGPGNSAWNEELDTFLAALIRQHSRKDGRKPWAEIYKDFDARYPGEKSQKAIQRRYENAIHGSDVELDVNEKRIFKKCVKDIESGKVNKATLIALLASSVMKKDINKSAVGRLLKEMDSWNVEAEPTPAKPAEE